MQMDIKSCAKKVERENRLTYYIASEQNFAFSVDKTSAMISKIYLITFYAQ